MALASSRYRTARCVGHEWNRLTLPAILISESINYEIQSLPEVADWKDLAEVLDLSGGAPHPDWQLPVNARHAAGGYPADTLAANAAMACLQISIMVADGMLDRDPRGEHDRREPGAAANLTLTFQSAAFRLIQRAPVIQPQNVTAVDSLARSALATAFGQHLDRQSPPGEENYRAVVAAKSAPFYGTCHASAVIMDGSSFEVAGGLYEFGILVGEIIQIEDDPDDSFSKPADPDWFREGNNLLVIYPMDAEYEQRDEFLSLLPNVTNYETGLIARAQDIVIKNGAVSYAAYHLVQRYKQAWNFLDHLFLPATGPIAQILDDNGQTPFELLSLDGDDIDLTNLRTEPISGSLNEGE